MLFLQGTRDDLARLDLIAEVCERLPHATLHAIEGADHSFGVLKRAGRTAAQVLTDLVDRFVEWGVRLPRKLQ
jgi:hypothetical protein